MGQQAFLRERLVECSQEAGNAPKINYPLFMYEFHQSMDFMQQNPLNPIKTHIMLHIILCINMYMQKPCYTRLLKCPQLHKKGSICSHLLRPYITIWGLKFNRERPCRMLTFAQKGV